MDMTPLTNRQQQARQRNHQIDQLEAAAPAGAIKSAGHTVAAADGDDDEWTAMLTRWTMSLVLEQLRNSAQQLFEALRKEHMDYNDSFATQLM